MNGEAPLIHVEGLSKKFCTDLRTSLKYGVRDLAAELVGQERSKDLRAKEFWALNDVGFELRRGECLGLLGRNGAGKTTLLKMLNGLMKPDKGRIELRGRIGLHEVVAHLEMEVSGKRVAEDDGVVIAAIVEQLAHVEDKVRQPVDRRSDVFGEH